MIIAIVLLVFLLTSITVPRINNALSCGLSGFSGLKLNTDKMKWLLQQNESRGADATGLFSNNILLKKPESATNFLIRTPLRDALKESRMILAHTRAATVHINKHLAETAHPFEKTYEGFRVVGAHNGWLMDESIAAVKKEFDVPHQTVDSEYIYAALAKAKGDFNAISKIEGVMALCFVYPDVDPEMLYLYRRASRPLNVGQIGQDIYFSSEAYPLYVIGCRTTWMLEEDTIYAFKHGRMVDKFTIAPPKIKSLTENTTRIGWRTGLTKEEREVFPEPQSTYHPRMNHHGATQRAGWAKNTGTDSQTELPFVPSRMTLSNNGKDKSFTALLYKNLEDEITNARKFSLPLKPAHQIADFTNNAEDGCLILLQLVASTSKEPLPGYMVNIYDTPEMGLTTPEGFVSLQVPIEQTKKEVRVEIYDPLDMNSSPYYCNLYLESQSVLEVTLAIPFRQNETSNTGKNLETTNNANGGHNREAIWASLIATQPNIELDTLGFSGGSQENFPQPSKTQTFRENGQPRQIVQAETSNVRGVETADSGRGAEPIRRPKIKLMRSIAETNKILDHPSLYHADAWKVTARMKENGHQMWQNAFHCFPEDHITVEKLISDATTLQISDEEILKKAWELPQYIDYLLAFKPLRYTKTHSRYDNTGSANQLITLVNSTEALKHYADTLRKRHHKDFPRDDE